MLGILVDIKNVRYSVLKIQYDQDKTDVTMQNQENGEITSRIFNGTLSISEIVKEMLK